MTHVQVKICGVCRPIDAEQAARFGASYIGVILSPGRPRSQPLERAGEVYAAAPGTQRVGVFVDPVPDFVERACDALALDIVQLHGAESVEFIRAVRAPVWKALTVGAPGRLVADLDAYRASVAGVLLDSGAGGTGRAFDWTEAASLRENFPEHVRLIVAGGLTPQNVAAAIQIISPDVVDVSSGVEAEPGRKSAELMQQFIAAARAAGKPEP